MTLDEAAQILNVKKDGLLKSGQEEGESELRKMLRVSFFLVWVGFWWIGKKGGGSGEEQ